jgi:hypothetical protein
MTPLALLLLALASAAVLADGATNVEITINQAARRVALEQNGDAVALTLDGSVYTLTPSANVTDWQVSLPEGANAEGYVYSAEVFVLPGTGYSIALPAEWTGFGCAKQFTLTVDPYWLVVQTFPGQGIACSTSGK